MADFTKPIQINDLHLVTIFVTWEQDTIGFGELTIDINDGKISVDTEGMSKEWTRRALYALADKLVDQVFDADGKML